MAVDYGRRIQGTDHVFGTVHYKITNGLLSEVTWPNGQKEIYSYTDRDESGVLFNPEHRRSLVGGTRTDRLMPDITWKPMLAEVRDGHGVLVEKHDYTSWGVVARTEQPGEVLRFSYDDFSTLVTNETTGELRQFGLDTQGRIISSSSTCSGCSDTAEYAVDVDNRRFAWRNRRGTWTTLTFEGLSRRVSTRTEHSDPEQPGSIVDSTTYRRTAFEFSPSASQTVEAPTLMRSPGVLVANTEASVRRSYDPNNDLNVNPTPQLRLWRGQGYTNINTAGDTASVQRNTRYFYDGNGRLTQTDPPRVAEGAGISRTYHSGAATLDEGRLATVSVRCHSNEEPVGCELVTHYSDYDVFGHPKRIVDPSGVVHDRTFDSAGLMLSDTTHLQSGDLVSTFAYEQGRLVRERSPQGLYRLFTYVAPGALGEGQLESVVWSLDASGSNPISRMELSYDTAHRRVESRVYLGSQVSPDRVRRWQFDMSGRVVREFKLTTDAAIPEFVRDSYRDAEGAVVAVADENHAQVSGRNEALANTRYEYDALSRLITVRRVVGATEAITRYTYDTNDNLRSVTDPDGRVTSYDFDDFGALVAVHSPDSGTTRFVYDAAGNLVQKLDAAGASTSISFDVANRVRRITRELAGSVSTEIYTYDSCRMGALCSVQDESGTTFYTYDQAGRLASETRAQGANVTFSVSYAHDALGRLSTITYPSGRVVALSYQATHPTRISAVMLTDGAELRTLASELDYDGAGALRSYRTGDGLLVTAAHDFDGQLTALAHAPMARSYTRDGVGSITAITEASGSQTFTYDPLDRLASALSSSSFGERHYAHDLTGNRTEERRGSAGSTAAEYDYAPGTNRLLGVSGLDTRSFALNSRGDVTSVGSKTLEYNAAARLRTVSQGGSAVGTYHYDYLYRRVQKASGADVRYFAHDFASQIIAELVPCAAPAVCDVGPSLRSQQEYFYLGSQRLALLNKDLQAAPPLPLVSFTLGFETAPLLVHRS